MSEKSQLKRDVGHIRAMLAPYRVTSSDVRLDTHRSDDLPDDLPSKSSAGEILKLGIERLSDLQERLYAAQRWSLLVVFQAMDAGGKDSTIKHVMSGINPQGVTVTSFKAPTSQDLAHDFLWRVHRVAPARGMIGVFNRSHYEDVLVTRLHPELLDGSHLPDPLRHADHLWRKRIADIAAFEAYLGRQGTRIVKFFLNVGRDEQKKRFLSRLDDPSKHWKFDPADLRERRFWDDYRKVYQSAIAGTATPEAPWYIVPADRKWFMRLVVAEAIIETLEGLDLQIPTNSGPTANEIDAARAELSHD